MTFIELCRAVHSEAGLSGDGPSAIAGQVGMNRKLIEWVRSAYQDIILMRDWDWLWVKTYIDVSPGDGVLDLSGTFGLRDVGKIVTDSISVHADDGRVSAVTFDTDFRKLVRLYGGAAAATPVVMTRWPDGGLQDFPAPDAFYELHFEYYRDRHELENDTAKPLIPEPFQQVIVWKALMRYASHDSATELLPHAQMMFAEVLQRLEQRQRQSVTRGVYPLDGYVPLGDSSGGWSLA